MKFGHAWIITSQIHEDMRSCFHLPSQLVSHVVHFDGLEQDSSNSSELAMDFLQPCAKQSILLCSWSTEVCVWQHGHTDCRQFFEVPGHQKVIEVYRWYVTGNQDVVTGFLPTFECRAGLSTGRSEFYMGLLKPSMIGNKMTNKIVKWSCAHTWRDSLPLRQLWPQVTWWSYMCRYMETHVGAGSRFNIKTIDIDTGTFSSPDTPGFIKMTTSSGANDKISWKYRHEFTTILKLYCREIMLLYIYLWVQICLT